ncbi:MAG: Uma2 family endonuclease [Gemmataceae bacterium]
MTPATNIVYPDSDGQLMAENTLQYEWIVTIKGNLDRLCVGERAAFVAGDNLIYPVEGDPTICKAPDVYVAFGRPRGHRGSYKVWQEGGIFPQVIFEILSPGNRQAELLAKEKFYFRYGCEEYVVYDPDENVLEIQIRNGDQFARVRNVDGWVSPLLGIRYDMSGDHLVIYHPDGNPFLSYEEMFEETEQFKQSAEEAEKRARNSALDAKIAEAERQKAEAERQKAEAERQKAETERQKAETERQKAETERQKAETSVERLRAKLRAAGIDPDAT